MKQTSWLNMQTAALLRLKWNFYGVLYITAPIHLILKNMFEIKTFYYPRRINMWNVYWVFYPITDLMSQNLKKTELPLKELTKNKTPSVQKTFKETRKSYLRVFWLCWSKFSNSFYYLHRSYQSGCWCLCCSN